LLISIIRPISSPSRFRLLAPKAQPRLRPSPEPHRDTPRESHRTGISPASKVVQLQRRKASAPHSLTWRKISRSPEGFLYCLLNVLALDDPRPAAESSRTSLPASPRYSLLLSQKSNLNCSVRRVGAHRQAKNRCMYFSLAHILPSLGSPHRLRCQLRPQRLDPIPASQCSLKTTLLASTPLAAMARGCQKRGRLFATESPRGPSRRKRYRFPQYLSPGHLLHLPHLERRNQTPLIQRTARIRNQSPTPEYQLVIES
jgi:hypothetical protein